MNRIMQYWPEFYQDIKDFVELDGTEDAELQLMEDAIERLLDNQFVLTSDEQSIKRRERMLKIQADPIIEALDFRKKRILNRYQTKPPFTIRYLQERLDFLVGANRGIAEIDVHNFILTVTTAIEDAPIFREVERTIYTIKPANVIYQQRTAVEDAIELEEHISLHNMDYKTRLSTMWRLGVVPFVNLGPEVVIQ
jgi:hypothetical protein